MAWIVLGALPLAAQTAQITGRVMDASSASIPGATVTVINTETGVEHEFQTNELGYYTAPLLQPGSYRVTVSADGFRSVVREGVTLDVSQVARLDISLDVGQVNEQITVQGSAPLLQSESAAVGQVITNKRIVDMPLNGRNFLQLATLTPGATSAGTSLVGGQNIQVNGNRPSKTNYSIDGMSVNDQHYDGALLSPSVDAVQEFKMQSNSMSAENGQGAAAISIELKSGTNQLHGTLFEFLRNDAVDARNFFNSTGETDPLRQNQYGFTLGGPIVKDKTFFFGDYQGTRVRRGVTSNVAVPSAAMQAGDYSAEKTIKDAFSGAALPNNVIPASEISPQASYFLDFIPVPNTAGGTYNRVGSQTADTDQFDIRIDHLLTPADSLSGSYSLQDNTTVSPGAFPDNGESNSDGRNQRASLTEVHTLSPTVFNEFRAGYVRVGFDRQQQGLGTNHTVNAGIGGFDATSAEFPGFPHLTFSGYAPLQGHLYFPLPFRSNLYNVSDSITWIHGSHNLKAGTSLRLYSNATANAAFARGRFQFNGQYTGDSFADFLYGTPRTGDRSFPRNEWGVSRIRNEHFFVQDQWKVTSSLTLDLGLRYELNHPPRFMNNAIASVDYPNRQLIVASEKDGTINLGGQQVAQFLYPMFQDIIVPSSEVGLNSTLRRLDKNNFLPRLGAAWRMGHDLVLRAGYGNFIGLQKSQRTGSVGIITPPFIGDEVNVFNTQPTPDYTMANLFQPFVPGQVQIAPPLFFQTDPDMNDPFYHEWNISLQKSFGDMLSLEAAYVGNKGDGIENSLLLNIPDPGPGSIQERRAWNRFGAGSFVDNSGFSSYHSLQMKAEVRSWRGLTLLAAYTFAKSIDNLSGDVQTSPMQDPNNPAAEKGLSNFDLRHRFTVSTSYTLPFGRTGTNPARYLIRDWEVGGILTIQTGLPFTPAMSARPANTGTDIRPDRIASGRLTGTQRTLDRDFDITAFQVPAAYTYGNSARNVLSSRGFTNLDLVVMRYFPISERTRVQFRSEFFNATNTPAFGNPVANIQAGTAGRILSAGPGREIQFGLKLIF